MRQSFKQARELWDKHDFSGSKGLLDKLRDDLVELGLSSSALDWAMGVTLDYLDEEEGAMAYLEKAQAADPLAIDIDRSIDVVLGNARRSLARGDLRAENPRVAMLYGVLHRRNEADRDAHLAFARHQIAVDQVAEARGLLEAMTRLYYPAGDVYELLAVCAERLGDKEAAVRARAEIERLDGVETAAVAIADSKITIDKSSRRQRARPS